MFVKKFFCFMSVFLICGHLEARIAVNVTSLKKFGIPRIWIKNPNFVIGTIAINPQSSFTLDARLLMEMLAASAQFSPHGISLDDVNDFYDELSSIQNAYAQIPILEEKVLTPKIKKIVDCAAAEELNRLLKILVDQSLQEPQAKMIFWLKVFVATIVLGLVGRKICQEFYPEQNVKKTSLSGAEIFALEQHPVMKNYEHIYNAAMVLTGAGLLIKGKKVFELQSNSRKIFFIETNASPDLTWEY